MYGNRQISKKTYLEKKETPQKRKKRNTRIKYNNKRTWEYVGCINKWKIPNNS